MPAERNDESEFARRIREKVNKAKEQGFDSTKVKILPWIGSKYGQSECPLLICGESVWDDPEYKNTPYPLEEAAIRVTEEGRLRKAGLRCVYDKDGNKQKMTGNFTGNLFWYLTGLSTNEARKVFPGEKYVERWEEWAFWDVVQERVRTSTTGPSEEQWIAGFDGLAEVMQRLRPRPRRVLGLSFRMAQYFRKFLAADCRIISKEKKLFEYVPTGTRLLFVKHPSRESKPKKISFTDFFPETTQTAVIRKRDGSILGTIRGLPDERLQARSRRGRILGTYDPFRNRSFDSSGHILAKGDILSGLVLKAALNRRRT